LIRPAGLTLRVPQSRDRLAPPGCDFCRLRRALWKGEENPRKRAGPLPNGIAKKRILKGAAFPFPANPLIFPIQQRLLASRLRVRQIEYMHNKACIGEKGGSGTEYCFLEETYAQQ
jgi:hypothetical protein